MATPNVQVIDCRDAPIQRVTVFSDRAEIKRKVALKLQSGVTEVNLRNVPGDVLDDSVRVSGSGAASIHEVQCAYKSVTEKEKLCSQALELRAQVDEAEKEQLVHESRRKILQRKKEALDNLINRLANSDDAKSLKFSDSSFESVGKLFGFYEEKVLELNQSKADVQKEEREAQEKLNVLREDLDRYVNPGPVKTVTVVLETESESDIELCLSYHVRNAYWRPSYDIRVENAEKKEMQITYSGCVRQHSDEGWQDCQLLLSTAKPAVGGNVPELGTLDVSVYRPPEQRRRRRYSRDAMEEADRASSASSASSASRGSRGSPPIRRKRMEKMSHVSAAVEEQALSSEFVIQRPAAIPPDGAEHKVTIGVATLSPVLQHECVPSKNNSVYLTASATNTSDLPFLAGEGAVFLDGNFISKSFLKAVSPGEVFTVSLGVDASIRVDYKPAHNVRGEAGLINKSANTVREQKITVKNTRREPVLVTVREHVPRSTDEKIKVRLLSPIAQPGSVQEGVVRKEGALVNPANNLEWTVSVPAQDKKDLSVKWHIDYPGNDKLDYHEKF